MRAVVQLVSSASVAVDGRVVGEIGPGLLVLLGVSTNDVPADADYLVEKIAGLRIFPDQDGKLNRSVADVGGAVLAVSQFTLYGDLRRGKRPSFDNAARPEHARELYEHFVTRIRKHGLRCETGQFQAMIVGLTGKPGASHDTVGQLKGVLVGHWSWSAGIMIINPNMGGVRDFRHFKSAEKFSGSC